MEKVTCAPSAENGTKSYTCYSDASLLKMRDLWNTRHPDAKITTDTPREIWQNLRINMQDVCSRETCWLRQGSRDHKENIEKRDH